MITASRAARPASTTRRSRRPTRRAPVRRPDWQVEAWVSTYTSIDAGDLEVVTDDVARLTGSRPGTLADILHGRSSTRRAQANSSRRQDSSSEAIATPCEDELIIQCGEIAMPTWTMLASVARERKPAEPKKSRSPGDVGEPDPLRARDLPRHLRRGAAADARPGRVAGELEHAPDEPRAVVAAVRLVAVGARHAVALAAPYVRHADLREREPQHAALGGVEPRDREGAELGAGRRGLPAGEVQDRRQRVRRLRARDRVPRVELERVVGRRVVLAQRRGRGPRPRCRTRASGRAPRAAPRRRRTRRRRRAQLVDQPGVEARDRHVAGQRPLAVEPAVAERREQPGRAATARCSGRFQSPRVCAEATAGASQGEQQRDESEAPGHQPVHRHDPRRAFSSRKARRAILPLRGHAVPRQQLRADRRAGRARRAPRRGRPALGWSASRGRGWALILPLSIAVVVGGDRRLPGDRGRPDLARARAGPAAAPRWRSAGRCTARGRGWR